MALGTGNKNFIVEKVFKGTTEILHLSSSGEPHDKNSLLVVKCCQNTF